jgi:Rad3-related DNA helicase
MDAVSGAAAGGERLVVQAPTGTGKTLGVLFPAARALADGVVDRVFFLTARTTGRRSARTTADQLAKAGARLRTVTLTARDKVCPRPEAGCRPEECDLARGYYDRVEKALADVWTVDRPGSADLTETAARHRVCPFELSLDAALDADLIVADYNYAFDPAVRLRRFFQRPREKYLFLIDEAHQLPDRVRSMHSAALTKSAFLTLRRRVKTARPDWWAALGRVNQALLDRRKRAESEGGALVEGERPDDLVSALTDLMELAGRDLADGRPPADAGPMGWDRYFDALAYVRAARRFDPAADAAAFISRGSDASAKLICLDPARRIADTLDLAHATALFSATLSPADHYNDAFGLDDRAVRLDLDSPFPPDNLKVLIADRVSTRYRDRTRTVAEVVEMIGAAVEARTANYMVFFPSYQYLDQAAGALVHRLAGARLIRQEPNMTEKDRADFLAAFERNPPGRTLVGLAVMGGVFGESVDLVGRRLSGAVVVGLGLPGPSLERNLVRAAYDDLGGDGFKAACLYPGLTRVWQAAGRVIRSETDRGVLLFIDQRFGRIAKRGLMPWPDPLYVAGPEAVREALAGFGDDPDRGPGDSAAAEKGLQSQ